MNVKINDSSSALQQRLLTPAATEWLVALHQRFNSRRLELLERREQRQRAWNDGEQSLGFLPETAGLRSSSWQVKAIPAAMRDRRVEITGPVERKMMINALNSGAKVFMADFEDAHAPGWRQTLEGQANVNDYYHGQLEFTNPDGKHYSVNAEHALLMLRVRGWHLPEKNFMVDDQPTSGALFDFGLLLCHNARLAASRGVPLYLYLPKMESHLEARLWSEVLRYGEQYFGLEPSSIRCTALIETLPAVFEMEEILYELRDHIAGLNCGRWDYIFSYIKSLQADKSKVLPDRVQVSMQQPFLKAYSQLLVQTCHRRGAYAMGGMAAQIPIKNDPDANAEAFAKVRADKELEADNGHDGTWVAHPGLVSVAMEVFERKLGGELAQLQRMPDAEISAEDLLKPCDGTITRTGFDLNVNAALRYTYAWLAGSGAVPINNLMEDVATAEISRSQLWQWLRHGVQFSDGGELNRELFSSQLQRVQEQIASELGGGNSTLDTAARLLEEIVLSPEFTGFLTLPAYQHLS